MDSKTIFTKTAKGLGEVSGKTKALSRDLRNILKEVDGKSPLSELADKVNMAEPKLRDALSKLMSDNYIREFAQPTLGENTRALDFSTIAPASPPATPRKPMEPQQRRAGDPALNAVSQSAPVLSANTEIQFAEFRRLQLEEQAKHEARTKANKEADEKRRREQEARVQRELEEWANKEVGDLLPEEITAPAKADPAKAAEEAARRAAEEAAKKQAEAQARAAAQEQARRQAEEQARLEAEAKARALAQEKARQEAEAAAQKAKQEAEAAARRAAEEQARKAAEEQLRREAEAKVRKEAEEKARREAELQAQKAAQEKARLEAEAKARKAAEEQARRAAEEKARLEAEQKARLEAEQKARLEAEQKAKRAAEEKARKEAEEAEIRAAAAKAKQAAEERARKEFEQAKREAEEQIKREAAERLKKEAEEAALRQAQAAGEIEELARLQEQEQARSEAEARAKKEAERAAQERARKEAIEEARRMAQKVRQEAGQKIKQDAEQQEKKEAEDWVRREVEERERRAAEARGESDKDQIEPEEHYDHDPEPHDDTVHEDYAGHDPLQDEVHAEPAAPAVLSDRRYRKQVNWVKPLIAVVLIAIVAGIGLIHVISFDGRIPALEKAMAEQFGQPVKIKSLYVSLLPQPHWRLEGVVIGGEGQITAPKVKAEASVGDLLGGGTAVKSIEMEGPVLSEAALDWLLFGKKNGSNVQLQRLRLSKATLQSENLALGSFDATATMADGAWKKIVVDAAETRLHIQMQPKDGPLQIELSADTFKVPFGAGVVLEHVSVDGTVGRDDVNLTQFRGSILNGTLVGNAHLKRDTGWKLTGQVTVTYLDAFQFAPAALQAGKLNGDAKFVAENQDLTKLLAAPQVEGSFSIRDGVLSGVDLAGLLRNSNFIGKTNFAELGGMFQYEGGKVQLNNVGLNSGLLAAKGAVDVSRDKDLTGKFQVEIKSSTIQSRAALNVAGTLKEPRYSR